MESLPSFITGLVITASATSMTGGVQATGGESIVTGDGYSSVRVENTINTSNQSGTSYTKVETNTDGVVHTEERTEQIPTNGSVVQIHVATSSSTGGSSQKTTAEAVASSSVVVHATASPAATEARPLRLRITDQISKFFVQVFGWFSFTR